MCFILYSARSSQELQSWSQRALQQIEMYCSSRTLCCVLALQLMVQVMSRTLNQICDIVTEVLFPIFRVRGSWNCLLVDNACATGACHSRPCRNEVLCIVFLKKAETACTFSLTPTLFFSTRASYFTSVVGLINVSNSSVQQDSVADGLLFPEIMNVVPERGIGIQQGHTPHGATQTQNALSMSMPRVGFEQTVDCSCLKPPGYCDWVLSNNLQLLWLGHITTFSYCDWVLYNNLQLLWLGLI